jgi:hypothetical protein
MQIAVMNAAQRHGELVTDLASEGARLPKPDVMGVGRPPAAAPIDRAARIIDSRCQREARAFRLTVCLAQHQPASSEVDTSGAALAQMLCITARLWTKNHNTTSSAYSRRQLLGPSQ